MRGRSGTPRTSYGKNRELALGCEIALECTPESLVAFAAGFPRSPADNFAVLATLCLPAVALRQRKWNRAYSHQHKQIKCAAD